MYAGALEWNNLDAEVRNVDDFVKLKKNTNIQDVEYLH